MKDPHSQAGVALVTALLIVSLATVVAVSFATQQQLDIRRTGNLIGGDQAWAYAKGAEDWAKLILRRDQAANSEIDALTEVWAQPLPSIDLPGGYMFGKISDAQARLNLNNLVVGNQVHTLTQQRLQRLLLLLKLDPNLVWPIVDWIDPDINARPPGGAEDDYYIGLQPPYRTSNRMMASVSELRLVKGFDEKTYQKIAPFVTALPVNAAAINVNTAPAEVLATVADDLDLETAVALVELRQENPFLTPAEFQHALQTVGGTHLGNMDGLDVTSQYFDVNIETRIGYGRAELSSLMSRGSVGTAEVIRRAQGFD
jgi:general secretion pathway protein K